MVTGHASGSAITGVTVTFTILAALMVAFRLHSRIAIMHNAWVDDVCIVIAVVRYPSTIKM